MSTQDPRSYHFISSQKMLLQIHGHCLVDFAPNGAVTNGPGLLEMGIFVPPAPIVHLAHEHSPGPQTENGRRVYPVHRSKKRPEHYPQNTLPVSSPFSHPSHPRTTRIL
jgi:hypothetical protein